MTKTQILDCTLRDGGYINDFQFGEYGIRKIIAQLTNAGIDIIECGFLEDGEYDSNTSVFNREPISFLLTTRIPCMLQWLVMASMTLSNYLLTMVSL